MQYDDLTPLERQILTRSSDLDITRRRRTAVIVAGIAAAVFLGIVAYAKQSWEFVLIVSLIYVAVTLIEKVAYANAVISYKSLIQKLRNRIEELEGNQTSQQKVAGDSQSARVENT